MNKMADFHIVLSSLYGRVKCPVRFKGEADITFRYFNQVFHIKRFFTKVMLSAILISFRNTFEVVFSGKVREYAIDLYEYLKVVHTINLKNCFDVFEIF